MYKAVNENIAQIKQRGATVTTLPSWALIGAELQNPKTGAIVAEYPGRGPEHVGQPKCKIYDCNMTTPSPPASRSGRRSSRTCSSTAVSEGMNVQNSILNSSTYLCVPPAAEPAPYSQAIPASVYLDDPTGSGGCPTTGYVEDRERRRRGRSASRSGRRGTTWPDERAERAGAVLEHGVHRPGAPGRHRPTSSPWRGNYGVDTSSPHGLTGRTNPASARSSALGEASLTVNEQTQMLATIDDNGVFHQAHIIKSWQLPRPGGADAGRRDAPGAHPGAGLAGPVRDGGHHRRRNGGQRGDGLGGRQIIGKTGTTSNYQVRVLHRRDPAVRAGRRDVRQPAGPSKHDGQPVRCSAAAGSAVSGPRTSGTPSPRPSSRSCTPESFPSPQFSGQLWNHDRPAAEGEAEEDRPQVHA